MGSLRSKGRGRAWVPAMVGLLLGLGLSVPAAAQTVLAGPRLARDCEAPIIYSFQYVATQDTAEIDRSVSTVGDDCSIHEVEELSPGEAADGPGTWYWAELPEDRPRYLVLGFHDVEAGEIGWVQLRNTSVAWYYRTNASEEWRELRNLNRRVLTWDQVSIALYNPPSEGDWRPLDIWYRFAVEDAPAAAPEPAEPESGGNEEVEPISPATPGS